MNYDCVIIANGEFPGSDKARNILSDSNYIVCCDGAVSALTENGFMPDAIVGDLDSISPSDKEKYKDIIYHVSDQETNDLTKSVNFAYGKGFRNIVILGATGKREDHTLANISLLCQHLDKFETLDMITDFGRFSALSATKTFTSYEGQQISIFVLSPSHPISTEGLRYPINDRIINLWWEASLNESCGDNFTIINQHNSNIVIYFAN